MFSWSIKLFRVSGIQISLHFSFLLLLAYVAYGGYGEAGWSGMIWSALTLIAFFTCVVLHEFGHSLTARRFGVRVRRILLTPIGGMAQFDSIPRQPSRELLITLAGPAVNFAIAGLLFLGFSLPHDWITSSWQDLGSVLLLANLVMGTFNLIPAFPMDGGRILRALLAMRLPYLRATFWASLVGKIVAGLGIVYALLPPQDYLLAFLFLFIFMAGDGEYRAIKRQEEIKARLREMAIRIQQIPPGDPPPSEPPLLGR